MKGGLLTFKGILFATVMSVAFWIAVAFGGYCCLFSGGCVTLPEIPDIDIPDIEIPGTTTTTTTTTTTIPPNAEASEALQKFSHPAKITHRIEYISHNEGGIRYTNPKLDWSSNELVGEAHLFVLRDGKWRGGKIDHSRSTTSSRDWNNVHDGYQGWTEPKSGEACAFMLISYDKTKRTNAIFFNWK